MNVRFPCVWVSDAGRKELQEAPEGLFAGRPDDWWQQLRRQRPSARRPLRQGGDLVARAPCFRLAVWPRITAFMFYDPCNHLKLESLRPAGLGRPFLLVIQSDPLSPCRTFRGGPAKAKFGDLPPSSDMGTGRNLSFGTGLELHRSALTADRLFFLRNRARFSAKSSLVPQRLHRIQPRRPSRRHIAGNQRDRPQQHGGRREHQRIARLDLMQ